MNNEKHQIEFSPSGRGKPKCSADPNFPNGKNIDFAVDKIGCLINLQYPAPECGVWLIHCTKCDLRVGITAASRVDDPRSIIIPCKEKK